MKIETVLVQTVDILTPDGDFLTRVRITYRRDDRSIIDVIYFPAHIDPENI